MDFPNFAFQNPDSRHISNEEATETTGIAFLKSLQSLNLKYANREQGGENDPKFAELIDHKKWHSPYLVLENTCKTGGCDKKDQNCACQQQNTLLHISD